MALGRWQGKAGLLPETAEVNAAKHLVIGGCDTVQLAEEYGTPLYVFDETDIRSRCREFTREFASRYSNTLVAYACKALVNRALLQILKEEGLGLDVVSGGEIAFANSVGFPMEKVFFHGNNKGSDELELAIRSGVGRIVVDNFHELWELNAMAHAMQREVEVLLRVSPGVDPHTHQHTTTGVLDSKFGFPISTGQAEQAVQQAQTAPSLRLVGLHFHLGSPIFELEPYAQAVDVAFDFAWEMVRRYSLALLDFSPGGGFAIQYVEDSPPPKISSYARTIVEALTKKLAATDLAQPRLVIEPGRSIVGRAGVGLYRLGARKEVPGVRAYVSVDGGLADNIRPAIYGARYEAFIANKMDEAPAETVTVAGKFCESGDLLVKDVALPVIKPMDVLAMPAAGAYCLAMASNYNASRKVAMVLVKDGRARLIRRRESYEDLMQCDIV